LLRDGDFDLGLAIPESISSALLLRLGGIARVVGFGRDPLRKALLHEVVPAPEAWGQRRLVSKERFVLRLMNAVGAEEAVAPTLKVVVTESDEQELILALKESGVSQADYQADPPVVLAPGAGFGESKCWPSESFGALGDRIAALGIPVIVLGAPGESQRVANVVGSMQSNAIVIDGALSVGGLKALLQGARALVANDAGARHVAAALGVPSVIFFGPTSVAKTADNLARIQILESEHDCRPCYQRTCPIDHRCLRSIDVDAAQAATEKALAVADAGMPRGSIA
jgi:heptosyltransferase-2